MYVKGSPLHNTLLDQGTILYSSLSLMGYVDGSWVIDDCASPFFSLNLFRGKSPNLLRHEFLLILELAHFGR